MAEFSPRCDGCHAVFVDGGDKAREPVTVGCFHTLCRACAEGNRGAYGKLRDLAKQAEAEGEGEGEAGGLGGQGDRDVDEAQEERHDVDPRVKELVRGRCGVCGGGKGGEIEVRDMVLEVLRTPAGDGEVKEGDNEEGARPGADQVRLCELCEEDFGGRHAATHLCEDCNEFMCAVLAKGHQRSKATAMHTVKEMEGNASLSQPSPPLCPAHQQPFLNYFCKADKCLVCIECATTGHSKHAFGEVGDGLVAEMQEWLGEEIGNAEAKVRDLGRAEVGFVEDRDEVTVHARQAINNINAVFEELEKKRKELISSVVAVRKEVNQRLNDVRTTAQLLRQGVGAVQRALQALAQSPSIFAIQRAERVRQQLRKLVEDSGNVRTRRGDTMPTLCHNAHKLKAWCKSLEVFQADGEWKVRPGAVPQPLPPLNTPRQWLTAVSLPSNDVFVIGGFGSDGSLNSVERLGDGNNSAWEEEVALAIPTARELCGACAVGTTVIVVGGRNGSTNLDVVEAVDIVSGVHTTLPSLPQKVRACGAVTVQGKVIVTGGLAGSSSRNTVWALDVGNFQQQQQRPLRWTSLPSMTQTRAWHGCAVGGGRVFVCGGAASTQGEFLDSCEMLRVAAGGGEEQGGWEALPLLPKKFRLVGCCFGGGNVFVAGGDPGPQRSVLALSVRERKWTQVAELATGRERCAAVCVGRRVMVLGGFDGHSILDSCEVFEF